MLQHLKHSDIDKKKWDSCITSSYNCRIYAMSFYLDVVCPQWEALIEDDYAAVMPLTARKKYGIHYLFQPHFTQQLGIFSKQRTDQPTLLKFLKSIPEKFRFTEICINTENSELFFLNNSIKKDAGFILKSNSNFELELGKNYREIYNHYSENTKRNIKKAIKSDVYVSGEIDISELISLFRKNRGKEFSHLKKEYYSSLKNLVEVSKQKDLVKMTGAYNKNGILCAGALFLVFKKRAIFLFSATNKESKDNGAMFFLLNDFIFQHAEILSILDFEGSNDANLARFYKSFGAKEFVFLQIKKNNLPTYIQWLKK